MLDAAEQSRPRRPQPSSTSPVEATLICLALGLEQVRSEVTGGGPASRSGALRYKCNGDLAGGSFVRDARTGSRHEPLLVEAADHRPALDRIAAGSAGAPAEACREIGDASRRRSFSSSERTARRPSRRRRRSTAVSRRRRRGDFHRSAPRLRALLVGRALAVV